MNEMQYNNADGIRRSDLWKIDDSPEKFKWFLDHPAEQTPAMAFGSACHKYILENVDFASEYAVAPKLDRRTKDGKEAFAKFEEENAGKTIISQDDVDVMYEMRIALMKCKLADKLINGKGETEKAFFWKDPETREMCKIKCDRIVRYNRRLYVVDYKTCLCAETNRFNSEIFRLGYHFQAGMYTEGVMRSKKTKKRPGFLFVAQEKKPPYSVNVIEVSEEVMAAGVAKFHELMETYHNCKALDNWPGYMTGDIPNDTFVPTWMQAEMEDEL